MVSTVVALVLSSIAIIAFDVVETERSVKRELSILAKVVGDRSSAALVFNDKEYAGQHLSALKAQEDIVFACLYTSNGNVLASYSRALANKNDCQPLAVENIQFSQNSQTEQLKKSKIYHSYTHLSHLVTLDGEVVGALSIRFDNSNAQDQIFQRIVIIVVALLFALIFTYFFSSRLQRIISAPIQHLSKTVEHVSTHNDYSIRADKHSEDELGQLVGVFNNMLQTIESQNLTVVAAERRFHLMYDEYPAMLFTIDSRGKILTINQFGAKQLGYETADALTGQLFQSIAHKDDGDIVSEIIHLCHDQPNDVHHLKSRLLHKDGSILWVKDKVRVISNTGNESIILIICENITEEHSLSVELTYQASHDALTGLVNRREFELRAEKLIAMSHLDQHEHALCFLDLDQFKIVNDTCGHSAGDALLRQIGSVLQNVIRQHDTLARLGGDEFGILLERCPLDQVPRIAESLLKAVQGCQFAWEGRSFNVGVSIGIVSITKATPNLLDIMKNADAACYMAKEMGRNRFHVYSLEDMGIAERRGEMRWVERINEAIEEDKFCLYLQTIEALLDGSVEKHYEFLIRMVDEQGKIIPPGAFLPAAERYNLIVGLDRWVVNNAFKLLLDNPNFLKKANFFAINISGPSLADSGFLAFVVDAFASTKISPSKICFEITETAAISNLSTATLFINKMKALGCRFALDDFGSGLSSFGYLKVLPVDYLKIDGMFVKEIVDDSVDYAMVKSINEIGHIMGMQTIAEFVESDTIKHMLKEIGVDYAQGYGISKPLAFEEVVKLEVN